MYLAGIFKNLQTLDLIFVMGERKAMKSGKQSPLVFLTIQWYHS